LIPLRIVAETELLLMKIAEKLFSEANVKCKECYTQDIGDDGRRISRTAEEHALSCAKTKPSPAVRASILNSLGLALIWALL